MTLVVGGLYFIDVFIGMLFKFNEYDKHGAT